MKNWMRAQAYLIVGLALTMCAVLLPFDFACISFAAGVVLVWMGVTYALVLLRGPIKDNVNRVRRQGFNFHLRRLQNNRSGVIWIWTMALMTMFVFSILWIAFAPVVLNLISTFTAAFAFPGPWQVTMQFISYIWIYFGVIMVLGILFWAFNASQRRDPGSYPQDYY